MDKNIFLKKMAEYGKFSMISHNDQTWWSSFELYILSCNKVNIKCHDDYLTLDESIQGLMDKMLKMDITIDEKPLKNFLEEN